MLSGEGPHDVREVTLELAAELLPLADLGVDAAEARARAEAALADGRAAEHFERWCYVQGGRWQPGEFHRLAGARGQGARGRVRDGRRRARRRAGRPARGRRPPHRGRHRRRGGRRPARTVARRRGRGRRAAGGRVLARSRAAPGGEHGARDRLHRRSRRAAAAARSCSAARTRRHPADEGRGVRVVGGAWRGRPLQAPAGRGHAAHLRQGARGRVRRARRAAGGRRRRSPAWRGCRPGDAGDVAPAGVSGGRELPGGPLAGHAVLDVFAGSGALGIEALSRGAATCTFVEAAPPALRALRGNLERLGVPVARAGGAEPSQPRAAPRPARRRPRDRRPPRPRG